MLIGEYSKSQLYSPDLTGPQHRSRHIVWYDVNADDLEYSDMRVPCKIELYTPRESYAFGDYYY